MNILNVFKLYYIAWHQKNGTREYSEFGYLKNNLDLYENILLKSNIDEYISNYNYSMYLDIWEKVCNKKNDYFLSKIDENIANIVDDASNILFYLSSQDILDYYKYTGADFNYNGENSEPSATKIYKNLLMIAKKLDLQLYNNILKDIKISVKLTKLNAPIIENLWNTLNVDSYGKVNSTNESYLQLEHLSNNTEIANEMTDFYNTLVYVDINNGK